VVAAWIGKKKEADRPPLCLKCPKYLKKLHYVTKICIIKKNVVLLSSQWKIAVLIDNGSRCETCADALP